MIETDALIIGSGPVGLFQVFELGLLGIHAHVVDALPEPGGQCTELYGDKPIYDIPAIPACTGRELIESLQRQIAPMHATFHLQQEVSALQVRSDGRFDVSTAAGLQFIARSVVICAGVGAFQPRKLAVDGLTRFDGTQLWYHRPAAQVWARRHVVVVGGGDAALDAVLDLAAMSTDKRPTSITLLHRRDHFQAEPASIGAVRRLRESGAVRFIAGQTTGFESAVDATGQERLTALSVTGSDAATQSLPADLIWVRLGLAPQLGPVARWGVALDRKQVVVDTEKFQTNVPGIYAVGDINTYPGKKKLILCGFHEATLAAYGVAAHLWPEQRMQLEYTTSSTRLHKILGVDTKTQD